MDTVNPALPRNGEELFLFIKVIRYLFQHWTNQHNRDRLCNFFPNTCANTTVQIATPNLNSLQAHDPIIWDLEVCKPHIHICMSIHSSSSASSALLSLFPFQTECDTHISIIAMQFEFVLILAGVRLLPQTPGMLLRIFLSTEPMRESISWKAHGL